MILYHSKLDLKKWCINRDYLMYQEGLYSKTEFLKNVEDNCDNLPKKTFNWRDRWKKRQEYDYSAPLTNNADIGNFQLSKRAFNEMQEDRDLQNDEINNNNNDVQNRNKF